MKELFYDIKETKESKKRQHRIELHCLVRS